MPKLKIRIDTYQARPDTRFMQPDRVRETLGRWLIESTPAADGVDWDAAGTSATVWRRPGPEEAGDAERAR